MSEKYLLQMKNISKSYYGTKVLNDINIALKPGEVHAIIGENGAGKSTLMNILFGMPVIHSTGGFQGDVFVDGQKTNIKSPQEAMKLGIGMVHQEFILIPEFTITENIKLNREVLKENVFSKVFGEKLKNLDNKTMSTHARKALDSLEIGISEYTKIAGLPVGYKQFTEIAREIDKDNLKVLVFDEPTAVLTENEAENLLEAMKKIAQKGIAILFISHRLDEVMESADNVTILRDGNLVKSKPKQETNVFEMAELMVGRKIDKMARSLQNKEDYKTILSLENLAVDMPGEEVENVNMEVKKGEILGIGGLAGQGKIGIANGVMGLSPTNGIVKINGNELKLNNSSKSLKEGLAFVSEDRRGIGLLLEASIEMNIAIAAAQNQEKFIRRFGPFSQLDKKAIREHALNMIKTLDIRCTGSNQPVKNLSGGNQQKVCIARALTMDPKILFVSEPTRGIDVGAKRIVLDTLVKLNEETGMTIIMTSSELAELRSVCDRIAIVTEGQIAGILKPDAPDVDYGLLMAGEKSRKGA